MCLLIALVETNIPCSIFVHSLISIKLQKTLTIVDFDSRLCNLWHIKSEFSPDSLSSTAQPWSSRAGWTSPLLRAQYGSLQTSVTDRGQIFLAYFYQLFWWFYEGSMKTQMLFSPGLICYPPFSRSHDD